MVPGFLYYLVPGIAVLYAIRKYRVYKWGWCRNNIKLNGKIALVTGANSGIGYEVAKELLKRGAQVIIACRDIKAGENAVNKIIKEYPSVKKQNADVMFVDLASLKSVADFAKNVEDKYECLDILINNAGVAYPDKEKKFTSDSYEIHFGVNHLSHFLLTNCLLDLLHKSKDYGRIVIVSSIRHERGEINLNNLNLEMQSNGKGGYANSKLANMYFCKELAKRTSVKVYSVCPGWILTRLFRHFLTFGFYIKAGLFMLPLAYFFMRSPKQGSQTIIYCATQPELANESGHFYRDCRKYKSKIEFDDTISQKLWVASVKMVDKVVPNRCVC